MLTIDFVVDATCEYRGGTTPCVKRAQYFLTKENPFLFASDFEFLCKEVVSVAEEQIGKDVVGDVININARITHFAYRPNHKEQE